MSESTIIALATLIAQVVVIYFQLKMKVTQQEMHLTTNDTHRMVNGDKGQLIAMAARLTRRVAELEQTPGNVESAIRAARDLVDHETVVAQVKTLKSVSDQIAAELIVSQKLTPTPVLTPDSTSPSPPTLS